MRATLDGTVEFEVGQLKVESWQREVVERAVAGLDGVLSIDLGARSRELVVEGILCAVSEESLRKKEAVVSALMDGQTQMLLKRGRKITVAGAFTVSLKFGVHN